MTRRGRPEGRHSDSRLGGGTDRQGTNGTPAGGGGGHLLDTFVGYEVDGGCRDCSDPVETMRKVDDGVYVLQISHDPGCPVLVEYERRMGYACPICAVAHDCPFCLSGACRWCQPYTSGDAA